MQLSGERRVDQEEQGDNGLKTSPSGGLGNAVKPSWPGFWTNIRNQRKGNGDSCSKPFQTEIRTAKERKRFETAALDGAGPTTTVWGGQRQKNVPTTPHLTQSESVGLAPRPRSPTSGSQESVKSLATCNSALLPMALAFQKLTDGFKPPKRYNDKPTGKLWRN